MMHSLSMTGRTTSSAASISASTSMPVRMPSRSQTAANTSLRRVAGAGAEAAGRAVDLHGAGADREHRVGHGDAEVLVPVEADLRVAAELGDDAPRLDAATSSRIIAPAESTT